MNELAQQLQRETVEGRLGAQKKKGTYRSEQEWSPSSWAQCVSDYEDSDDEIHTPSDNEEEDKSGRRMRGG